MMLALSCVVLGLLVVLEPSRAEHDLLVAFCKDTADGEWRKTMKETFAITGVGIAELFCSDVSSSDVVIATLIGSKYEQFAKHRDEHMDAYIAKILRKISSYVITTVKTTNELQESLKNNLNAFVAFISQQDSLEHRVFQQVALSVQVPDDLHIIVTHNRDIFSNRDRQLDANKNMEVWFVQHDKWVVLEFPVIGDEVTPEEAHFKLVTYMRHLKYPLISSYTGDDFVDTYKGAKLDYLLIFHATDQREEMTQTIAEPLSREFQLYFAFILIDCEKFPKMLERFKLQENVSLPQLMSLKNGQKKGVHIDSNKVSYSDIDGLIRVLTLVKDYNPEIMAVDPEYMNAMNATNATSESPEGTAEQIEEHHHTEL